MGLELVRHLGPVYRVGDPRPGRRALGISPGGAFDPVALRLARALVGSDDDGWEIAGPATFRVERSGSVAVVGLSGEAFRVTAGDEITLTPPSLRSVVLWGPRARAGRLATRPSEPLLLTPGPHATECPWREGLTVSSRLDRRGVRLEPDRRLAHPLRLPSFPLTLGAVEVTPAGEAIVIGPDGPTTGGYPVPRVVALVSRPQLAYLCPGEPLLTRDVTLGEAQDRRRDVEARLARWLADLAL